jgi:hypothetical protein
VVWSLQLDQRWSRLLGGHANLQPLAAAVEFNKICSTKESFPMTTQPVTKRLEDEKTVTMFFPRKTALQLDSQPGVAESQGGRILEFEQGINEVPVSLSTHSYLRDSGARPYTRNAAEAKAFSDQQASDAKQKADAADAAIKSADAQVVAAQAQAGAELTALKTSWDNRIAELKAKADKLRGPKPATPVLTPAQQKAADDAKIAADEKAAADKAAGK